MQKTYKKGEVIFKDGDKIQNITFIQSGGVNQCLVRGKKNIDLFQLGSNQILGEGSIIGQPTHNTTVIATAETKVVEIPIDTIKQIYEGAPQPMKIFIKSLIERMKLAMNDVRSSRMEKDSSPCPEDQVAKVYGCIYFTASHKGERDEKDKNKVTVDWGLMRSYIQKVLGESPKRMEQAINVLVKLKLAKYHMDKLPEDPEGPDVIVGVEFYNLNVVEAFFEFYQYYFFKPGKGEILKYDDFSAQMLEAFIKLGDQTTPDRFGIVSVDFLKVGEEIKSSMGINFNNDHFARLEQKGVLCKRRNIEGKGVFLEFEIKEYKNIFFTWKIIREIEKWNEKGFVDMDEKDEKKAKKTGPSCPQCSATTNESMKFCPECGAKLGGSTGQAA